VIAAAPDASAMAAAQNTNSLAIMVFHLGFPALEARIAASIMNAAPAIVKMPYPVPVSPPSSVTKN